MENTKACTCGLTQLCQSCNDQLTDLYNQAQLAEIRRHDPSQPVSFPENRERKTLKGRKIASTLQDIRMVLMNNTNHMLADYIPTRRGVPRVKVWIAGVEYSIVYFGNTNKFRIFRGTPEGQIHIDIATRNDVITFMRMIKFNPKEAENYVWSDPRHG